MLVGQKLSLQYTIFGFCIFQSNKEEFTFNCPVIPPPFHTGRFTPTALLMLCRGLFFSLPMSVHILRY
jgi:hypothetical protein